MHLYTRSAMDGCAKACYVLGERFAKGWKADKMTLVDRDYDAAALWLRKAADLHASTPEPEVDVADVQLYDDDSTWMNEWLAWNEERKGPPPIHEDDDVDSDDSDDEPAGFDDSDDLDDSDSDSDS